MCMLAHTTLAINVYACYINKRYAIMNEAILCQHIHNAINSTQKA